ncbi:hypothetical protein PR202_ga24363 [Eleusine coracana subsp. coracana]|uniref:Uncharacterized protein n=1 Tax=Eleusine coracana subsp. coracana TaxID=191504 RepID=A0AAV5D8P0_ELECO|nr:hypothetical protein PR202_ga24363 [Eleusine coracana subsp. coracana]
MRTGTHRALKRMLQNATLPEKKKLTRYDSAMTLCRHSTAARPELDDSPSTVALRSKEPDPRGRNSTNRDEN